MDGRTPAAWPRSPRARDVYWQPWSEWWIPWVGRRWVTAMFRASRTSSVRRCVAIAHPTTRRLQASRTTARYRKPAPVAIYVMSATQSRLGPAAVKMQDVPPSAHPGHVGPSHEAGDPLAADVNPLGGQV